MWYVVFHLKRSHKNTHTHTPCSYFRIHALLFSYRRFFLLLLHYLFHSINSLYYYIHYAIEAHACLKFHIFNFTTNAETYGWTDGFLIYAFDSTKTHCSHRFLFSWDGNEIYQESQTSFVNTFHIKFMALCLFGMMNNHDMLMVCAHLFWLSKIFNEEKEEKKTVDINENKRKIKRLSMSISYLVFSLVGRRSSSPSSSPSVSIVVFVVIFIFLL